MQSTDGTSVRVSLPALAACLKGGFWGAGLYVMSGIPRYGRVLTVGTGAAVIAHAQYRQAKFAMQALQALEALEPAVKNMKERLAKMEEAKREAEAKRRERGDRDDDDE
ncbi:hypothetical protein ABPG75_007294 [Micractinium tetrahymenae]